jgi:hypothetical protein
MADPLRVGHIDRQWIVIPLWQPQWLHHARVGERDDQLQRG